MRARIRRVRTSTTDRGASAVEYGLMVAAIAAMIVGIVFAFGNIVNTSFQKTSDCIEFQGTGDPWPNCTNGANPP
jgi:pilus assembly protein Flp/PilA